MFSANSSQVSDDKLFVEDVFSTYLFNGQGGSTDYNVINGVDLAGKGGLVWSKFRTTTASNWFIDTARGALQAIASDTTDAQFTAFQNMTTGFLSNGFTFRDSLSGFPLVSWTFREAPKFFDVVTYTGNGSGQTISHSLGVAPGSIFIKDTGATGNWWVYHRSTGNNFRLFLNTTDAAGGNGSYLNSTDPTATNFTLGANASVNNSGSTYVAYLFAHDTTSDGIIQCGSFTADGSGNATVSLGWEPQWLMIKSSSAADPWYMADNMRGMPVTDSTRTLRANSSIAEQGLGGPPYVPNATGFSVTGQSASATYIYIAIRRGPMRTPTSGTSVFSPVSQTPSGVTTITTGFPVDLTLLANRDKSAFSFTAVVDRLRGTTQTSTNILTTNSTGAEGAVGTYGFGYDRMTSITDNYSNSNWGATTPVIYWNFRRAPSFFDEVCYTGTGVARTINHNLGVAPELMIVKIRNFSNDWRVYYNPNSSMYLNTNQAGGTAGSGIWNNTDPTATVFSVGNDSSVNGSGGTYVAYLFASCPGVSKVGSYTGNGSSQTINCGFAAGARFVMIKRTDSTGDWYVWDSARGIVSGNDPRLSLNNTNAEVTTDDSVDTDSSGFVVNQLSATNINVSSATYLYLAVA